MQLTGSASLAALAACLISAPALAQPQTTTEDSQSEALASQDAAQETGGIGDILVTAQRRETNLQDTPIAISAFSGESLEADRVLSFEDLAGRATSLSFTALSPLDQEFNIRGITNTRLDSPSADQSIGIFVDDVYVGRSGLFNFDLYDIERVEVIRGPQGVLLGRNVVGGAISIVTAGPDQEPGGSFAFSYGNYDELLTRGHVTGPLSESLSARFSYQIRRRDGYNRDILHGRDLDDIRSQQFRAQLAFSPDPTFRARLVFDYTHDESNGFHSVAFDGSDPAKSPWLLARERIGVLRGRPLGIRESLPEHPRYKGDANETSQQLNREAWGLTLNLAKDLGRFATFESVTGYRKGDAFNLYSQTGIGPDNGFGVIFPTLFEFPVNEEENIRQFSQEVRLVSQPSDSGFEWIVGGYYQRDKVDKFDRFWAEVPAPIGTLSGESHWDNSAKNISLAAFGQLGFRFSDMFRVVAGIRYTRDKKTGTVTGIAVEGGDKFNPNDLVALTPLATNLREGDRFTTDYGDKWSELTPQITLEFTPTRDIFFYATYATGYKGGGFEDDPANAVAARTSYDPETVKSFEVGAKLDFLNRRARLNVALFSMDYKDLQVTQTNQDCLCNITDNAADAKIKGAEIEAQLIPFRALSLHGAVTLLDTKYLEFVDSLGRDTSGNYLQRTPKVQYNIGADLKTSLGEWRDALSFHVNYTYQGKLYWAPDNVNIERGYGLLDARISFTPDEGRTTLSLWAKNLTKELYRTNIIAFFGDEVSRLGTPRTYGVEARFDF